MIIVTVENRPASDIMEIVRQLRQQGLAQGRDFDFAYHQATSDPVSGHWIKPKRGVFCFYKEKYATFFALKYS